MKPWAMISGSDGCFLVNSTGTKLKFSNRTKMDFVSLMARMEEANVPLSYTEGVGEIYFTVLRGDLAGDCLDGKIRLSTANICSDYIDRNFVHELAHHVDENEDASSDERLINEWRDKSGRLEDLYAREDPQEYLACGFEIYYFGNDVERRRMRQENKRLYRVIHDLHSKYSAQK